MDVFLKKLELHGFKSFPDKTVVQFHPGITAVIGPNGCGKSNVVDAVLWVLGEQRIKNLRGENNEDLIFNGSANKKPLGMTEVGVTFANRDSDLYIARRYFRAGESKYILNEKFCRNKDIQDQLFELGVGERNYFIFEQGSVEKMVSLKPTERRILIEEAAGIAQYLERKKETASKLVIAQQNLDTLDLVLTDKSARLKELKNQVAYARRYRAMKNQKNDLLKTMLRRRYDQYHREFEASGESINKQMEAETLLVRDIADQEKDVLALEQQRWNLDRGLKEEQQRLFEIANRILTAEKEGEKGQQRQEFLRQRMVELEKLIRGGSEEIAELDKRTAALQEEIDGLNRQIGDERRRLAEVDEAATALAEKRRGLDEREAALKKALFALQSEESAAANALGQREKARQRLDQEIRAKEHLLTELDQQVQQQETATLAAEIETLTSGQAGSDAALAAGRQELDKLTADLDGAVAEARRLRGEMDNLRRMQERLEKLRGKLSGEAGAAPAGGRGRRLQEMIRADKRHLRLLENFYFDEIDAPLAEDAAAAAGLGAPKVLLKRPLPFVLPDAVRTEPGFLGTVKELFTLEAGDWREVLADGVVADTLANGLRIFFRHGVDVVTRDAEVISRRGLLFRSRERGILEVVEEIKETERKLEAAAVELTAVEARRGRAESDRATRRAALDALDRETAQRNEQLIALRTRLETQQKNQEISRHRSQLTRQELDGLRAEREGSDAELQRLTAQRQELAGRSAAQAGAREALQQEGEALRQQVNENERDRLSMNNGIDLLSEKLDSRLRAQKDLAHQRSKRVNQGDFAASEIAAHRQEIAAIEERLHQGKAEVAVSAKEKSSLQAVVQTQESDLTAVSARLKELGTSLADRRQRLEALRERRKEDEIRLASVKKDLFQLEEISNRELNMELKEIEAVPEQAAADPAEMERELNDLSARLDRMRESDHLNFSAESEYEILDKDFQNLIAQKEDIVRSIQDMNAAIDKIDSESKESFHKAFAVVRENFLSNFKILFEGGDAALTLTDSDNVLEAGLEIHAQPPGKRLQSLRLLSGGEKTLTSLAFLFALFQYKPSPFCVFDEVDASLDEANIQRFLKFLHKLKQNTQFLIITHNFKTMEEADFIYGISMDEPGISKMYSMKMT